MTKDSDQMSLPLDFLANHLVSQENNNLKTKNSSESAISKQLHDQISALKTKLSAESKITKGLNKQILELRTQISDEKKNNTIREN